MKYHTHMIHTHIPRLENLLVHAIMRGDDVAEAAYYAELVDLYEQRLPNSESLV